MHDVEIDMVRDKRIECYVEYRSLVSENHWDALIGTLSSKNDTSPGTEIYVAVSDNLIVGSIVLFPGKSKSYEWTSGAPDYPEIRMLAVDRDFRGKGIGRSLVMRCIDESRKKGYFAVGLHTAEFMKNAILLYTKMNFKRMPEYDFEPADDGIIVKGFKYTFGDDKEENPC
ncbi:GNAT family N-acetyltransferase [Falsibacillus albus]|uniref:GNAT family N-acetyltransferase n=2 Tax=Falsibacillus albus TaxID=2478915 RepID=A0A3L7K390_9BACI|nr:GNAT family N-acetyltransferase [Falsibacillus albus]